MKYNQSNFENIFSAFIDRIHKFCIKIYKNSRLMFVATRYTLYIIDTLLFKLIFRNHYLLCVLYSVHNISLFNTKSSEINCNSHSWYLIANNTVFIMFSLSFFSFFQKPSTMMTELSKTAALIRWVFCS